MKTRRKKTTDPRIVVLAAGEGTRMKSGLTKVLHALAGRPMLAWVLDAAAAVDRRHPIVTVLGRGHDGVREILAGRNMEWVVQKERLGTGHAVLTALGRLKGHRGEVMVLCGDTPLLEPSTLRRLLRRHRSAGGVMTMLTARLCDPRGYGRVMRDGKGRVAAIVEQKELKGAATDEVNTGVYVFNGDFLRRRVPRLKRRRKTGEYYLTDLAEAAAAEGMPPATLILRDPDEALGVNSRRQLAEAARVLRRRILGQIMDGGVTVVDPDMTYVAGGVKVGRDTILMPGTILEGKTRIGRECRVGPWSRVADSTLGDRVEVRDGSVVEGSRIRAGSTIGPMARLRPGTLIGAGARVGNFVEVKKSVLGRGVKASHLTYLGDALIGPGANIGAGTVTCNYDGISKHRTIIGEGTFIGSDTMLVAPVRVGRGAVVGAGSVITRDVPDGALGLARAPQVNRQGWVRQRRALGRRKGRR